jgi:stage V sporulation protein D (sporulation-specific penicillin-binding protein)
VAKRKLNAGDRLFTRAMIVLFCVVFGLFGYDLVKGLVNVQLVRGAEYAAKAKEGQLHDTELAAPRGTIYDTNGAPIAQSTSAGRVYINPNSLSKLGNRAALLEEVCDGLASVLGVSAARVRQQAGYTERNYMVLKGQVELDRMEKVNAFRAKECVLEYVEGGEPRRDKDGKLLLDAKGNPRAGDSNDKVATYAYFIGVSADVKRFYPLGSFAANLLGFTGAEDVGRAGLELLYNSELTGTPGRVVTAKNAADSNLNIYYETNYDAVPGNSLVLTIDEVIQRYLDRALEQAQIDAKAKAAYGIIMDVKTGAILGMSCAPSYDPGNYEAVADPKKREEIAAIADPEKREAARKEAMMAQWRNGTIELTYEPGSVFKTVTLSAALEEGLTSPGEHYTCTGSIRIANRTIHCHKRTGHGNQDLARGLMNSCNPFMITLGQRMGVKTFYKYFTAFGFTEPTGIDLPNEFKPTKGINIHAQDKMGIVELASCSFGQSFEASPIQILSAVSAIANGGKLMQPYVVKKVLDAEGRTVRETQPTVRRQVISAETAKTVCGMMEQVVSNGTGRNGYVSGGRVAGKTGTSQKLSVGSGYVASFVSFAPADAPEVAMLIAIDEPGGDMINGGQLAAPPTAEVLENVLVYKNIEMRYTEKEKEQLGGSAPDMVTLTPTAAKEKLQTAGYTAKIIGEGSSVLRQIPEPGQSIQQGGLVILYTGENTERTVKVPKLTNLSLSEAKRVAAEVGLNIKLTGNLQSQSLFTYRQSIAEGAEVPLGTAVTVNIMTDNGIRDR